MRQFHMMLYDDAGFFINVGDPPGCEQDPSGLDPDQTADEV